MYSKGSTVKTILWKIRLISHGLVNVETAKTPHIRAILREVSRWQRLVFRKSGREYQKRMAAYTLTIVYGMMTKRCPNEISNEKAEGTSQLMFLLFS